MKTNHIKAIIGLGNPGPSYYRTRHNIGFRVLDTLAQIHTAQWRSRDNSECTEIIFNDTRILLIKPTTFMNNSGHIIPFLRKQGIDAEHILVVHDELEKPFGNVTSRSGGSARGHNGLKSIITACGENFMRIRCGIGRPENRDDVPTYVLSQFSEGESAVENMIEKALQLIEQII
jgi:peptidyl-tRNA hydrolase, PTH1 family